MLSLVVSVSLCLLSRFIGKMSCRGADLAWQGKRNGKKERKKFVNLKEMDIELSLG